MVTNNVVCMKWGKKYPAEYVNILYRMVKRNMTIPFRFICFTDDGAGIDENIEVFDFLPFTEPPNEFNRHCVTWRKLSLFKDKVYDLQGKILFLDLDVIVVDNIDCFFDFVDGMAIIENWSQPNRLIGQASAFCFNIGQYTHLLEAYMENPGETALEYRTEQVYITRKLGKDNFTYFPDDWCKSFKFHCLPGSFLNSFMTPKKPPKGSRIIVFHGNPNPPEAMAGVWGKPVPWYKKFYKSVQPTPWIGEHWK